MNMFARVAGAGAAISLIVGCNKTPDTGTASSAATNTIGRASIPLFQAMDMFRQNGISSPPVFDSVATDPKLMERFRRDWPKIRSNILAGVEGINRKLEEGK